MTNHLHGWLAIAATALLGLGTACGVMPPDDVSETGEPLCGGCEPQHANAKGVVNVEGGNSCVYTTEYGLVCPLAFNNLAGGGVSVTVWRETNTEGWDLPVSATYGLLPVTLTAINANQTNVSVTYTNARGPVTVTGGNLANFTFTFTLASSTIQLKLNAAGESPQLVNGVWEQKLRARVNGGAWSYLCKDDVGADEPGSLLGGAFIDWISAARTASSATSMISCKKGGITTCMQWGYRPWESAVNEATQQSTLLVDAHLACIQMKRAAYCGDESWTLNGTPIQIDDAFGIHNTVPALTEAVWTPSGASCVNLNRLRHPELHFNGQCGNVVLPACSTFEPSWWLGGNLVADGLQ